MSEWMEKNKKLQVRSKKVVEYQKYVQTKTKEKQAHKKEFVDTANEHLRKYNKSWMRKNDKLYKHSMQEHRNRRVKSQETDIMNSSIHQDNLWRSASKN